MGTRGRDPSVQASTFHEPTAVVHFRVWGLPRSPADPGFSAPTQKWEPAHALAPGCDPGKCHLWHREKNSPQVSKPETVAHSTSSGVVTPVQSLLICGLWGPRQSLCPAEPDLPHWAVAYGGYIEVWSLQLRVCYGLRRSSPTPCLRTESSSNPPEP